jgi:hypothetical protein
VPSEEKQSPHRPSLLAAIAACSTLERLGYTWSGGVEWKPPLGKPPAYITGLRERTIAALGLPAGVSDDEIVTAAELHHYEYQRLFALLSTRTLLFTPAQVDALRTGSAAAADSGYVDASTVLDAMIPAEVKGSSDV